MNSDYDLGEIHVYIDGLKEETDPVIIKAPLEGYGMQLHEPFTWNATSSCGPGDVVFVLVNSKGVIASRSLEECIVLGQDYIMSVDYFTFGISDE